jgi:hypothetical protein
MKQGLTGLAADSDEKAVLDASIAWMQTRIDEQKEMYTEINKRY